VESGRIAFDEPSFHDEVGNRTAPGYHPSVVQTETKIAVLFADVSDSTQLYESLGDRQAVATVSRCLDMARDAAVGCGGRLVRSLGDEVMLVFSTALQAAEAALEIQKRMSQLANVLELRLAFHVGFHFGAAIERDGDIYGDSVNTAARLVALAKAGQILTSSYTVAALPAYGRPQLRDLNAITVKGKQHDLDVVELVWQATADLTMVGGLPDPQMIEVELRHRDSTIILDAATRAITLGRDEHNDVVIREKLASRLHARIERRHDKFALVDSSVNGTYVTFEGESEFLLHRQECLFKGRGRISFGRPFESDASEVVSFVCSDGR
jgi:class 3 adenylate cyclase